MKKEFYKKLQDRLNDNEEIYLMTIISGTYDDREVIGTKLFSNTQDIIIEDISLQKLWKSILENIEYKQSSYNVKLENEIEVFVEYLVNRSHLVICGGGHIALPLCELGRMLEFKTTVIDEREEFANFYRFPMADNVICGRFDEVLNKSSFSKNTYFVIVTRGHKDDKACLEAVIDKDYDYVGMIGSRAKVANVVTALINEGYSRELIDKVHTPIGLKIGGQTPAEIAVSIAAEIIQEKNRNKGSEVEEVILNNIVSSNKSSVLATIVEKSGSSPRDIGTKMLICEDRNFLGTIGGGSIENSVYIRALELMGSNKAVVESYDLSDAQASTLGMVCGGKIKVIFECI